MALNSGKILMRRGQEVNFDPNKMMPGEWAVSLDSKYVRMCFSPGVCIRMATYEAFEADMEQIRQILAECESVEEAVSLINTEVSQNAKAVIEHTKEAKQYRDEAKQYRDEAFSTTPDGYDSLVGQVNKNTVAINAIAEKAELNIKETAMGDNIHLIDSEDGKNVEFALYGKATQNATPTPQNPVDIEVAGSDGSVKVKSVGKNLLKNTETTQTINGVKFTVNEDKSITVNGTNNSTSNSATFGLEKTIAFTPRIGEKYIISGGKSINNAKIQGYFRNINGDPKWRYAEEFIATTSDKINFCIYVAPDETVNNITFYPMIRLASDTDDTYEPYKETLSTIQTENGLAGIPVDNGGNYTDSNGQQWICDEIVKYADGSGEYVQRVKKVVFDGSEDEKWTSSESVNGRYTILLSDSKPLSHSICSHAIGVVSNDSVIGSGKCVINSSKVYYINTDIATLDEFKTWLSSNSLIVYYEIAEPIRTPLTEEQLTEIEKLSTFYPVTNISNDGGCGMKVRYIVDSKNYIDNQLAIQAKLQEEALVNMLLLMPEEVQASMIEKDTDKLLSESEV